MLLWLMRKKVGGSLQLNSAPKKRRLLHLPTLRGEMVTHRLLLTTVFMKQKNNGGVPTRETRLKHQNLHSERLSDRPSDLGLDSSDR